MTSAEAVASAAQPTTQAARRRRYEDLLKESRLGIVDSPLFYRESDELDRDVEHFHQAHELANIIDLDLLRRGARLAKDERLFIHSGDLSGVERRALEKEENPRLREQSKDLQVVLLTCCMGAVVQGWSQANITGANLHWPAEFGLQADPEQPDARRRDVWIFGAVNAISYFAASLVGVWLSDPLNEYLIGRRGTLFVSGLISFAASIGSAFTYSWPTLFLCRLLQGIGMGTKASVVPILEAEVSPAKIRGRILVSWQTFTAVGIFLGSAINLIVHKHWRLQIVSGFVPTIPLLCLVFVCSESPRWLIKQNQYGRAYEVLRRLRHTPLQAARDLYNIHAQIQVETILFSRRTDVESELQNWSVNVSDNLYQSEVRRTSYWGRLRQLFSISRNRRAGIAASLTMASQQLSGVNIFAFLAATFLNDAGLSPINSLWLAFGFAAANAFFSPFAYPFIDTRGRRFLLLFSLVLMVPLLLATAFSFKIPVEYKTSRVGAISFFLILYTAVYSPGAGVVPFMYSSEVFPLVNREAGMSLCCAVNFFLAGVLALTLRQLIHVLRHIRVLSLFAGLDAAAAILVWLFVPGTVEGTSLEEMNYIFGVPMRRHFEYQVRTVLPWVVKYFLPWFFKHYTPWMFTEYIPWAIKRYVLRSRDAARRRPEPSVDSLPYLTPLHRWNQRRTEEQLEHQSSPTSPPAEPPLLKHPTN